MKKIVSLLLIVITVLLFSSCSVNEIDKLSKEISIYTIEAVFEEETMELYSNQNLKYINNEELPLNELCFHLYPNAYRQDAIIRPINNQSLTKAYPNGMSYGNIDILKTEVDGIQVSFNIGGEDMNILTIPLSDELFPGEKISVDIEFNVKIPNVLHRFGYGDKTVNFGNWYPVLCVFEDGQYKKSPYYSNGDPFYSDCSNYNVSVTVPEAYKGAFSGTVSNENANGKTTYNSTIEVARDFAFVLSKDFKTASTVSNEVEVNYYYYNDLNFEESLTIAAESIDTFTKLFGAYKYKTLAVVQAGFLHGGMEYPTLIYISDKLSPESYKETIVHETAHQWWYSVVGSNQVQSAWLDEGLTEYSTVLFYENNPKYNLSREQMINETLNSYKLFVDIYKQIMGTANTSMNRAVNEYTSEYEYVYMTYVKGELLFDAIRTSIGDDKFYKGMKKYYKDNAFKHATPAHLITSLERGSGVKLESFINSWIDGTAII